MSNLLKTASRKFLFGSSKKNKLSITDAIINDSFELFNMVWNPDRQTHFKLFETISNALFSNTSRQPRNLVDTLDKVFIDLFGLDDNIKPKWYCKKNTIKETLLYTKIELGHTSGQKLKDLRLSEAEIEEALYNFYKQPINIRFTTQPTAIEIDKVNVPVMNLKDFWEQIKTLKQHEKTICFGMDNEQLMSIELTNQNFGAFICSLPGYGKSQTALSILLSFAALNSPDNVNIYIGGPKKNDFTMFKKLAHVQEVTSEIEDIIQMVETVVQRMDKDNVKKYRKQGTLLFIDELSDLIAVMNKSQRDRFTTNIQRLEQRGRSSGISIVLASQRAYDIPVAIHEKLELRIIGKTRNNNDAFAATGLEGVKLNKLQVGRFELYPSEKSIRTFFIADTNDDDYEKILNKYIKDINMIWNPDMQNADNELTNFIQRNKIQHSSTHVQEVDKLIESTEQNIVEDQIDVHYYALANDIATVIGDRPNANDAAIELVQQSPESLNAINTIVKEVTGKGISSPKRKEIAELLDIESVQA